MKAKYFTFILISVLALSCRTNTKTAADKAPVAVKVLQVQIQPTQSSKTYVGKVESATDIYISSPFSAKLTSVKVKPGQIVREGDILAELYSEHVESVLASAQATVAQAEDAYERLLKVKDNGSVSELKMVEVQTQLSKARSALRSAQKSKEDCIVRAPVGGALGEIKVSAGENLSPMQQMFRLIDLESLVLSIDVPEMELNLYHRGSEALVSVPALGDGQIEAKLTEKGVSSSLIGHSYKCKLSLSSYSEGLRPGMIGKACFKTEQKEEIVLPTSVIRRDDKGSYVWTVSSRNTVAKQRIETGDFSGKGVIVLKGLQPSDRVICEGMSKVSTGMRVSITE